MPAANSGPRRLRAIRVEHTDAGARLTVSTDDPALVDALHRWGAAQVRDHGEHAEHRSG